MKSLEEHFLKVRHSWESCGTKDIQMIPSTGVIVGLHPQLSTWAIMVGLTPYIYGHRYCYPDLASAQGALNDWRANNFEGEPEGYLVRKGLGEDKRPPGTVYDPIMRSQ